MSSLLSKIKEKREKSQDVSDQLQKIVQETKPKKTESLSSDKIIKSKCYEVTGNVGYSRIKKPRTLEESNIDSVNAAFQTLGNISLSSLGTRIPDQSRFIEIIGRGHGQTLRNLFDIIVQKFSGGVETNFPLFKNFENYIGGYSKTSSNATTTTYRYTNEQKKLLLDTEEKLTFTYIPERNTQFVEYLEKHVKVFDKLKEKPDYEKVDEYLKRYWYLIPSKNELGTKIYITDEPLKNTLINLATNTFNMKILNSLEVGGYKEFYLPIDVLENILNSVLGVNNWTTFTSSVFKLPPGGIKSVIKKGEIKKDEIKRVTSIPDTDKDNIYLCRCIYIDVLGNCTYAQIETIPNYGKDENGIVTVKNLARRAAISQTFVSLQSIKGSQSGITNEQREIIDLLDGMNGQVRTIALGGMKDEFISSVVKMVNSRTKDITKKTITKPDVMMIDSFDRNTINKYLQIEDGRNEMSYEKIRDEMNKGKRIMQEEESAKLVSSTKRPMELENVTSDQPKEKRELPIPKVTVSDINEPDITAAEIEKLMEEEKEN